MTGNFQDETAIAIVACTFYVMPSAAPALVAPDRDARVLHYVVHDDDDDFDMAMEESE